MDAWSEMISPFLFEIKIPEDILQILLYSTIIFFSLFVYATDAITVVYFFGGIAYILTHHTETPRSFETVMYALGHLPIPIRHYVLDCSIVIITNIFITEVHTILVSFYRPELAIINIRILLGLALMQMYINILTHVEPPSFYYNLVEISLLIMSIGGLVFLPFCGTWDTAVVICMSAIINRAIAHKEWFKIINNLSGNIFIDDDYGEHVNMRRTLPQSFEGA